MTLLQRGVIQRLRERGYDHIAALAHAAWSKGERLPIRDVPESAPQNLITDLARANEQVGREELSG
jgi:hypothetical protein